MKTAFNKPYIGTKAELKLRTIRQLKQLVSSLNSYKGRAVICKNMIVKLLGVYKSWGSLNKQGLIDLLTAWKNLEGRWKKGVYSVRKVGSEVYIVRGETIYKRYIPAQKLWEARRLAAKASGLWITVRKAKRCIGWKWEVECWFSNSQEDLLATTTYTTSGSFTEKKSPQNPFINKPVEKTSVKGKSPTKKAVVNAKKEKEAREAYEDIFGVPPQTEVDCHDPSPYKTPEKKQSLEVDIEKEAREFYEGRFRVPPKTEADFYCPFFDETLDRKQFVKDSISEAYKFVEQAGWTITLIDRSLEENHTSIRIIQDKVIFWIETGRIIRSPVRKKPRNDFSTYTRDLFPDEKEVFKISHKPRKGWFKEHVSGVLDTNRQHYKTLEELAEEELGYVEIPF